MLQPIIHSTAVGLTKSARFKCHSWTWISCTIQINMAVLSHVIYGRSWLSESSKACVCLWTSHCQRWCFLRLFGVSSVLPTSIHPHHSGSSVRNHLCWFCGSIRSYLDLNRCVIICVMYTASICVRSGPSLLKLFTCVSAHACVFKIQKKDHEWHSLSKRAETQLNMDPTCACGKSLQ